MKKKIILLITVLLFFMSGCVYQSYELIPFYDEKQKDCVERAVEIVQQLRKQGYEAYLVLGLYKEGSKIKGHMWVKYKEKDGKWYRIDNLDSTMRAIPTSEPKFAIKEDVIKNEKQ